MREDEAKSLGRYPSLILRHHPEAIGITLDEHGWADVEKLIAGMCKNGRQIDRVMLDEIVATNNKQRYSYNDNHTLIRANQGHSIPVDAELPQKEPPEILWHGTGEKFVDAIRQEGLRRKSRLYVHLSSDPETAVSVGSRHGKPVVFCVYSGRMARDGFAFWQSVNGVWLTKAVPPEYLERI